jgi:hypothetical protein
MGIFPIISRHYLMNQDGGLCMPLIRWIVSAVFVVFILGACQQYGFEELPSSVIRTKRYEYSVQGSAQVDILFVIDNSQSMVGEQKAIAESFSSLESELNLKFGEGKYQISVVTTGIESPGCNRLCTELPIDDYNCINETGEAGRFQDRLGKNEGQDKPRYTFQTNQACKIIDSDDQDQHHCFFDPSQERGVVLVGIRGSGYERGLAAMKRALTEDGGKIALYNKEGNTSFLRSDSVLAVIVISDEDDCGEVGDLNERIDRVGALACYYASKGEAPDGSTTDPHGDPWALTPVQEYYDFLVGLKGGRSSMVRFAAIVGIRDKNDLSTTQITYEGTTLGSNVDPACSTASCTGRFCSAKPGTRYLQLAKLFGNRGFVDTICQDDFSETMKAIGTFVTCISTFKLNEPILDPALANVLINKTPVPQYTCDNSDQIIECSGPKDTSCPAGSSCLRTWTYTPPGPNPDPSEVGGVIEFQDHYDPCINIPEGETLSLEVVFVTD